MEIRIMKSYMLFLVVLSTTACRNQGGATDNKMTPINPLAGTWKFLSLSGTNTRGDVLHPYGQVLFGRLMYDQKGYMSFLAMHPDRPRFASGDVMGGTPEEIKEAFQGFDAYCGTYTIDQERALVTHHLEGARFPNWIGTDQVRYFQTTNDTLRIKAPPILADGVEWTFEAVLVKL